MPIQDWGVTYAEMEPHHDLFERLFGISGKAGNIKGAIQPGGNPFEAPRRGEYPQKPIEITEAGTIFKAAAEKFGYHVFPCPAGNSSGSYTNPDGRHLAPCQYCGHCERFVCEANAKASPILLLYPTLLERKGFEMRLRSHVLGINYDRKAKRATGVRFLDLQTGCSYSTPVCRSRKRTPVARFLDLQTGCSYSTPVCRSRKRTPVARFLDLQTGVEYEQ